MWAEILPPCPSYDEDEKLRFRVTSVGIWTIVYQDDLPAYFLIIKRADSGQWGIPAGGVEDSDQTGRDAAKRELYEETGLSPAENDLQYMTFHSDRHIDGPAAVGRLLYLARVNIQLLDMENRVVEPDGTIRIPTPTTVDQQEIAEIALVPLALAFKGNLLNNNPYMPRPLYRGLTELRARGLISGSFLFEYDPGLD